jgi:hypothetical protein
VVAVSDSGANAPEEVKEESEAQTGKGSKKKKRTKKGERNVTLVPARDNGVSMKGSSPCGEVVHVVVSFSGETREMVFHRPIGVTELAEDAWVLTPARDMATLLSRKKHPHKREVEERRRKVFLLRAVHSGLLNNDANHLCYPNGEERMVHLRDARKRRDEDDPYGLLDELKEVEDSPQHSILKFLPKEVQRYERAVIDLFNDDGVRARVEEIVPLPSYSTAAGQNFERPQLALELDENLDSNGLADRICETIQTAFAEGQQAEAVDIFADIADLDFSEWQ